MPAVSTADLSLPAPTEGSAQAQARVVAARARQQERFAALAKSGLPCRLRTNAEANGAVLEAIATPDAAGATLLRDAAGALGLSARGYHRALKVARTLADLDGAETVGRLHVAEALSYRGESLRMRQAA